MDHLSSVVFLSDSLIPTEWKDEGGAGANVGVYHNSTCAYILLSKVGIT